jgi:Zn-dependent protease with chaperone function
VTSLDEVEFYNGKSPVPEKGELTCGRDYLTFRLLDAEQKSWKIKISEIIRIEKYPESSSVVIKDDRYYTQKLVLYNTRLIFQIEKKYYSKKSFFIRAANAFHSSSVFKLFALAGIIVPVFVVSIYYGFSQAYKLIPETYDKKLGARSYLYITGNLKKCDSQQGIKALEKVKKSISDNPEIKVTVVDSPVVNAFALPGGQILFFRGFLEQADSPEEVFAIMAHEASHVELRHSMQQLTRTFGIIFISSIIVGGALEGLEALENISEMVNVLLVMKYSRGFEKEADDFAIKTLIEKNISLHGFQDFFKKMSNQTPEVLKKTGFLEWISTHPADKKRIENIEQAIQNSNYKPQRLLNKIEFNSLKNICLTP